MRLPRDVPGKILFAVALALAWLILGCGVKQLTTEVQEDGSGRNIFIVGYPKADPEAEDYAESKASLEQSIADAQANARACGASTLPYADEKYQGYQAILTFRGFAEIPGQISCMFSDTSSLDIDGRYEQGHGRPTYVVETRIKPFALWVTEQDERDPMLYRVVMPGRIEFYTNLDSAQVRTVKEGDSQVSWYFTQRSDEDADLVYDLRVEAEGSSGGSADMLVFGAIFALSMAAVAATGAVVWKLTRAATHPQPAGAPPTALDRGRSTVHQTPGRAAGRSLTRGPATPPRDYPPAGTVLDRYEIRAELGRGGMAAVYCAWHDALQREVALKVLAPRLTAAPDFVQRFRQEGHVLARLSHPHIVSVYDAGTALGYYYLVMEMVKGQSLDRLLRQGGRLEPRRAVALARQVAQGLDYAHGKGVVHRDIKPANIMLDGRGQAKVTDFGVVAILGERQAATTRIGTPPYMAYEHFNGAAVPQSDLYSLGVCLYEMLTGKLPPAFGLETPLPPSRLNPAVSPALDHAVLKCLRPDARRRYASARDLEAALRQSV